MINDDHLVSVIMPVYKVEKYLRDSVQSVLNQTYRNIEIILVNDGSPDNCPDICDSLAFENNNIKVIHKANGGLSDARNSGVKIASGKYIFFLDSDDKLVINSIEEMMNVAIRTNSDVVFPDSYIEVCEESNKEIIKRHFHEHDFVEEPVKFAVNVMIGRGRAWRATSVLYRKKIIDDNNILFPVGYIAEDIVFNFEIMRFCEKIACYRKPTLRYLKRAGSITMTFQENLDEIFLFIDKKAQMFADNCNLKDVTTKKQIDSLLCRNSIIFVSSVFSKKCDWEREKKYYEADKYFKSKRVTEALKVEKISPYTNKYVDYWYYQIVFRLLKLKNKHLTYFFVSNIMKIRR